MHGVNALIGSILPQIHTTPHLHGFPARSQFLRKTIAPEALRTVSSSLGNYYRQTREESLQPTRRFAACASQPLDANP